MASVPFLFIPQYKFPLIIIFKPNVQSIQLHTAYPYELIVINELDDPSGLERYKGMPGFRCLTWPGSFNAAEGFQIGASLAEGELLVFMHDYIAVTSQWLADLAGCLEDNRSLAVISPMMNDITGEQRLDYDYSDIASLYTLAKGRRALRSRGIRKVDTLAGPLLVIRKSAFIEMRGFYFQPEQGSLAFSTVGLNAIPAGYELAVAQDCTVINLLPSEHDDHKPPQTHPPILNCPFTISLCMIVKNEEQTLARCLSSANAAIDEIIIVDTGSIDNTKVIASDFTDNIYDFAWVNDFAKARNYAFSKAMMDYIFWLDADDVLLPPRLLSYGGG